VSASTDTPQSLLKPGEVLAEKYRVERLIGRGGMAEVYAAHHEILQQTVAIKVLLPSVAESRDASARFLNEARSAARIRGENVATVMDVGTLPGGAAYMVLEYLEGKDLEAYVEERGALPPAEAVEYVLGALQAIAQAHALGIIHRDLKPSNLFLARRPDGSTVVKVLDFGISKVSRGSGQMTIDGHATASQAVLGSPFFMAPEQARSAKSVDPRADIWAVGVILHRLLTGELPFMGETLTELLLAIVQDTPAPIRQLRPELPEALEAVVLRCLRKSPVERFANVAELATALAPFAAGESTTAVARIGRTLAAHTPAQPFPVPAGIPALAASAPSGGTAPGPGTASSWAEASAARNKKTSLFTRGRLLAGGAATAVAAAVIVVAVSRSAKEPPVTLPAPGATGITQEPTPQPLAPAPAASVVLPATEPSASSAPSASASEAPSAAPAPSASPARRAGAMPNPPAAAKPVPGPPKPAPSYDLLNQRN
jgi:eukaryotic-like serine/threonine-protein kinase